MAKFKRVIVAIVIILSIMLLNTGGKASAALPQADSSSEIISFDEYSSSLTKEYAKYGITYKILQKNDNVVLTRGILEEQLATAKQQGEAYIKEEKIKKLEQEMIKNSIETSIMHPMVMYINKTYYDYKTVKSPSGMGKAQICLEAQATADADKGVFLWTNYGKSYQSGPYVNFKSWKQDSKDCFLYTFPGSSVATLALVINGTLTVEYTEPNTGLLVGYSSQHALNNFWTY